MVSNVPIYLVFTDSLYKRFYNNTASMSNFLSYVDSGILKILKAERVRAEELLIFS